MPEPLDLNALDDLIDSVEDPRWIIYFDPKDGLGYSYDVKNGIRELLPFDNDDENMKSI